MVALSQTEWQSVYPMDFYANESLGEWTVNNEKHRPKRTIGKLASKTSRTPTENRAINASVS